jgi:predicted CXXCH cytochrome family protein
MKKLLLNYCRFLPVLGLALGLLCAASSLSMAVGVVDTLHNLSASGTGDLTTDQEVRVCIFCHTPHHANSVGSDGPLWSRSVSGADYTLYSSSSVQAAPGQPAGSSRLCLSCHDGTIALGMLVGGHRPGDNTLGAIPPERTTPDGRFTNLLTDLSDDHPISFVYDSTLALDNQLHSPATLPGHIRLENNQVECATCHDAHLDYYGKFLVMDNVNSALCEVCHDVTGWTDSSMRNNPAVKCESCHTSHTAGQAAGLLLAATEEGTCTEQCHNGSGGGIDVRTSFAELYVHPVESRQGVHDLAENPLTAEYHVECVDCHNAHQATADTAAAPFVSGPLKGVSGIDVSGAFVATAQREFEICFKCHSSNPFVAATVITRQLIEAGMDTNLSRQFNPANPTYHPVVAAGRNTDVPSLGIGYDTSSIIYCTDCHNNSEGAKAGGNGANGVHGSENPTMLIARYEQDTYPEPYFEANYALCWRCHDPGILLAGGSFHAEHVQEQDTPCSACHDPHGIPADAGASTFLINFDIAIVDNATAVHDPVEQTCIVSCHSDAELQPDLNSRSY